MTRKSYFNENKIKTDSRDYILSAQGRYYMKVRFLDTRTQIYKDVEGTATAMNMNKEFYDVRQRAFNNATLKYYDFQSSAYDDYLKGGVEYSILNEHFVYNKEKVVFKNVKIRGKTFVQVRDKKSGRFIATNKKKYSGDYE